MRGLAALTPEAASVHAARVDAMFFGLLILAALIIALVLVLVVTFAVRYRRGSRASRGETPTLVSREFEIGWTAATLFVFVFIFWFAASSEITAFRPPTEAIEVHVVAKQWMWKTQSPSGVREINELHVPVDVPVRLVLTSEDVIHSFYVPAFRLKRDVLPGTETETWFRATKTGVFHLFCSEYCGTDHSRMVGRIVVMEQQEYARWLEAQPEGDDLSREGAALFSARGCAGCHAPGGTVRAPNLAGIYGRTVALDGDRTVVADDAYIRDSILHPRRDVTAGYAPVMPSYAGHLSDGEVQSLTAYIRSLAGPPRAPSPNPVLGDRAPGGRDARSPAMVPGAPVREYP